MLTRAWTGRVAPDWNVRVTGADEAARCRSIDPGMGRGRRRARSSSLCLAGRARCLRRHRRAPPPAGVSALLSLRRQSRGRRGPGAGRLHPRVQGPEGIQGRVEPGDLALPDRGERHASIAWRSRRREASRSSRASASISAPKRPDTALLRSERAAEVRAAIRQLPPKQRATLILRIYHELPHDEIARILGSSVGAAKANLFHALANLKKLLR